MENLIGNMSEKNVARLMIGIAFIVEVAFIAFEIATKTALFAGVYFLFKGEFLSALPIAAIVAGGIILLRLTFQKVKNENR